MATLPKIKASSFVPQLRTHKGQGYVYGMRGKDSPYSTAIAKSKQGQYGKQLSASGYGYYCELVNGKPDYTKGRAAKWLGKPATDCSGLIRWVYWELLNHKYDFSKSASGMYSWCSTRGKISTMPKKAGILVFKTASGESSPHHVGVYLGNGTVIEAAGVDAGIRIVAFNSGWTHWGVWDLLDMDIPVDGTPVQPPVQPPVDEPDTPAETAPIYFTTTATLYRLWDIGKSHNIAWTAIRKADGSVPNPLAMRAGIKLIVGHKIAEQAIYYTTTKKMYLLGQIGNHFGVDWHTIRNADGSTPDPRNIHIGQVLRIK